MKCLLVYWKDAVSEDAWLHVDTIKCTYSLIQTVGWLIREDDEVLILGLNHDVSENNFSCMIHIPVDCVLHRQAIEIPQARQMQVKRRPKDKP